MYGLEIAPTLTDGNADVKYITLESNVEKNSFLIQKLICPIYKSWWHSHPQDTYLSIYMMDYVDIPYTMKSLFAKSNKNTMIWFILFVRDDMYSLLICISVKKTNNLFQKQQKAWNHNTKLDTVKSKQIRICTL